MSMLSIKDTNPKDSIGIKKVPMSTVSVPVIMEIGVAMLEGSLKYGRHNYRIAGVRASVYYDAFMRHVGAWWEGEDIDPASGLNHLAKAMACLTVLRDSMIQQNWVDDRPPKTPPGFVEELNKISATLIENCDDPKPAYTACQYSQLIQKPQVSISTQESSLSLSQPAPKMEKLKVGDGELIHSQEGFPLLLKIYHRFDSMPIALAVLPIIILSLISVPWIVLVLIYRRFRSMIRYLRHM